jgi:protein-disulfide isomerase
VSELGSAPVPAPSDGDGDHRRFGPHPPPLSPSAAGAVVIAYADFECPFCAVLHERLTRLPVEVVFRHFPVRSSHPRAWPAACAAEAAARQGRFWEMHDVLFRNQGHLEPSDLRRYAERVGVDLAQFESDLLDPAIAARIERDVDSGDRSGVDGTPSLFIDGSRYRGPRDSARLGEVLGGSTA